MRRSARGHERREGFTLLEVLLAVAVFGLVVGSLMEYLSQNVRSLSRAREEATAVRLAEARMRELLLDIDSGALPAFGETEGSFEEPDDDLRWILTVEPYEVLPPEGLDAKEVKRLEERSSVFAPAAIAGSSGDEPTASISIATLRVFRGDEETPLSEPLSVFAVEMPSIAQLETAAGASTAGDSTGEEIPGGLTEEQIQAIQEALPTSPRTGEEPTSP